MLKRVYFPLVVLFWVVMNVLLWRSEMSGQQRAGGRVPVATVWDRILTAPDDSSLQVFHHGQKLGYCRWVTTIVETGGATAVDPRGNEIEGRVRSVSGYTIELDGNVLVDEAPRRIRFTSRTELSPNRLWQKFQLRLNLRPSAYEVRADAAAEQVTLRMEDGPSQWERAFTFAELRQPENLIASLGLPATYAWLGSLTPGLRIPDPTTLALGLQWEARNDWLVLAHSRLRVVRVEARLLDKYRAVVFVSRVGEILRVELPGELVLINDAILNLAPVR